MAQLKVFFRVNLIFYKLYIKVAKMGQVEN